MRIKTVYINKETKERVNKYTLYDETRKNFETEEEWLSQSFLCVCL